MLKWKDTVRRHMQTWTGRIGKVSKTCYLLPCRKTHVEMEGHCQKGHESLDTDNWKGLQDLLPCRKTHVEMEGHRQKAHASLDRENWKGLQDLLPATL